MNQSSNEMTFYRAPQWLSQGHHHNYPPQGSPTLLNDSESTTNTFANLRKEITSLRQEFSKLVNEDSNKANRRQVQGSSRNLRHSMAPSLGVQPQHHIWGHLQPQSNNVQTSLSFIGKNSFHLPDQKPIFSQPQPTLTSPVRNKSHFTQTQPKIASPVRKFDIIVKAEQKEEEDRVLAKIMQLQQEIIRLKDVNKVLHQKIDIQVRQLQIKHEEFTRLTADAERWKQTVEQLKRSVQQWRQKANQNDNRADFHLGRQKHLQQQLAQLSIKALQNSRQTAQSRPSTPQSPSILTLYPSKSQICDSSAQLTDLRKRVESYQKTVQQLNASQQTFREKVGQLNYQLQQSTNDQERQTKEITGLRQDVLVKEEIIQSLYRDIGVLEVQLGEVGVLRDSLRVNSQSLDHLNQIIVNLHCEKLSAKYSRLF